ncbi:MAG: hypothetical protein C4547_04540 [Phycisphaerales bacterium]|nr:MAG: hypothetical protein C4547_04540 [Phycisphaerales bacterium]
MTAGFESTQINTDNRGNNIVGDAANEPSIVMDPNNADLMAIGWRQFDTINSNFREAGLAYSRDGGRSWTNAGVLDPGEFRTDPVLRADSAGNFFYSSLSTPQLRSVEVFRSTDGGVSWSDPAPAFGGDKQWIAVDRSGLMGDGHVYQTWNVQFTCCPNTDFTRSIDSGFSYQGPFAMPSPRLKWGTMAVDPDSGSLYIVGSDLGQTSHVLVRSDNAQNGGVPPTFPFITNVNLGGTTRSHMGFSSPNPDGLLGQVWIDADYSNGPSRGNLYVLASVDPPGGDPLDIHFIRSTDGGRSWSPPVRVNDDEGNAWQWLGTLSVAASGRIDALWDDTRNGGGDPKMSQLFYTWSTDAGVTWARNVEITETFNSHLGFPRQNKMGDYNDMISTQAGILLAYCATFNGEQDIYFSRIEIDCNNNGVHDGDDIARGASRDDNHNGIPDECEACTGNERIARAACKFRRGAGKLKVKLVGGAGFDSFLVRLSSGQSGEGQLDGKGKGRIRITGLPPGAGTASVEWGCGAQAQEEYSCE